MFDFVIRGMLAHSPWGGVLGGGAIQLLFVAVGVAFALVALIVPLACLLFVAQALRLGGHPLLARMLRSAWPLVLTPIAAVIEWPAALCSFLLFLVHLPDEIPFDYRYVGVCRAAWVFGCVAAAYALTRWSLRGRETDSLEEGYDRSRARAVRLATMGYGSVALLTLAIGAGVGASVPIADWKRNSTIANDRTPPTIEVGPDVVVTAGAERRPQFVDLTWPTVSDDSGLETTLDCDLWDPTLGWHREHFPIGVTVVTWTARDLAGNESKAVQKVTVLDPKSQLPAEQEEVSGRVEPQP